MIGLRTPSERLLKLLDENQDLKLAGKIWDWTEHDGQLILSERGILDPMPDVLTFGYWEGFVPEQISRIEVHKDGKPYPGATVKPHRSDK